MRRISLIVVFHLCWLSANYAQEKAEVKADAIQQMIELISENLEQEDQDFTTLLEELNYFYGHPLNLNKADRNDLRRLLILNDFQIEALIRHREATGNIMTIEELQGIPGFDVRVIRALKPFVRVSGGYDNRKITWEGIKSEGSHEAFIRYQRILEEQQGFKPISDSLLEANPNSRFVGTPERVFTRYRFRYLDNLSFGITAEKDAGESFGPPHQPYGFDFYSAHFYVGNRGFLKKLVIGDYQAQFGQGLVFWSGLAFGKFADIRSVKRNARGISPYVSVDENNFLRGAATTLEFGPVEFTAFGSYKGVDGNLTQSDSIIGDDEILSFSSFQLTGRHATPSEIEDRRSIKELNAGGHLRLSNDMAQIGVTAVYSDYDLDFTPDQRLYRKFESTGAPFVMAGFDYQFIYRNILGFGENALRWDGGTAYMNGAILSLDQGFDISLIHRDYSERFNGPRSNAFGESSRNSNERGLFLGFDANLSRKWRFSGYYDLFQFDWLRFRTDAPSEGSELFTQLNYSPNKRYGIYVRYRYEEKEENFSVEEKVTNQIGSLQRHWTRFHAQFELSPEWEIRSRVEYTQVHLPEGSQEDGWLIYQDLIWKPASRRGVSVKLRYAMFDTESYDSRIYAYENDVLYGFSVPAFYNRGTRAYVITKFDVTRWSDLTIRLAQTYFDNRDSNGSGLTAIDGPTRTEIKLQYRLRF